jgi:hypothetical protein
MRTRFATTILCSTLWLTGCSLTMGFDDFSFGSAGSSAADGGPGNVGGAGNAAAGSGAAQAGRGGAAGASAGNAAAGASGSAGAAGSDSSPPCSKDADCGDTTTFHCVLKRCALRRVPSGSWLSGGGGTTRSSQFVLHISVGAPAPMGVSTSKNFSITVGAGAGRP